MDVYAGSGGAGWKVTNVTETAGQNPAGRFVAGFEVTYQLKSGLTGTVFLPKESFNEDAVAAAVGQAAQILHNVSQLQSGF